MGAGLLVHEGRMWAPMVILVAALGNTFGNLGGYALGALGGRPLVVAFGRRFGVNDESLGRATAWFDRYGGRVVAVSRLIGLTRTPAIWASGLVGMSLWSYVAWAFLGNLIWAAFWSYLGIAFGFEWARLYGRYRFPLELLLVALAAFLLGLWYGRRQKEDSHAR